MHRDKMFLYFPVTKGLMQGCSVAPSLFKMYIKVALSRWKRHCREMRVSIIDDYLCSLVFADDQVEAVDEQDSIYMIR